MKSFLRIIKKQQLRLNSILLLQMMMRILMLAFFAFSFFFAVHKIYPQALQSLFLLALSLKIGLALAIIFIILKTNQKLFNKFRTAKYLDQANQDKADTFQNALELENSEYDPAILQKIFQKANEIAERQHLCWEAGKIRSTALSFLFTLLAFSGLIFLAEQSLKESYQLFSLNKKPQIEHKNFVEISPGDITLVRNSDLKIEVMNPELEVMHKIFYRYEENWREEILKEYHKNFNNLENSFSYFVKTPYAVSDTFLVKVFELPIVTNFRIRYDYPAYTKQKTNIIESSNGNIKALAGTSVTLEITANNPIKKADLIFADGNILSMKREGKNIFSAKFEIKKNSSYHINLLDILGNKSRKLEKIIRMIPDNKPQIKIVSPGKDTLLTQNMLLPLEINASDDFGLQDMELLYNINNGQKNSRSIQTNFSSNLASLEFIFDLNKETLIPGDKVTYWAQIADNSPQRQTAISQKYLARFPSIQEIYEEIEKREKEKTDSMEEALKRSQELQKEFEQKRRELLKKDEIDWEDKKQIQKLLDKQEELNQDINNVAEDFKNLMEKFEDNQALSSETLEKMKKIQELMEDIADEKLQKELETLREKMEKMDPEALKKAMKNFEFSMEDFSEKLDQTLQLLEDIKKERSLQKALEISEEMEEMQNDLQQKTEKGEQSKEKLAKQQKEIADKLQDLKDQLKEAQELLDEKKDKELLEEMKKLQEMMEKDSLAQDMQKSMENLQANKKQKAQKNQQKAQGKMQKIKQQLQKMQKMMASGMMMDASQVISKTIQRLLIFSQYHENVQNIYEDDPFMILQDEIAIFEGIQMSVNELYKTPMIILIIGAKFMYDANYTKETYREFFQYVNDAKVHKVEQYLIDIRKGLNYMIYDLMQAQKNMMQGGGSGGMQSLMQSLQQMGQQQMAINMMTQQMMQQMTQNGKLSSQARRDAQKLAADQQQLAENLKRILQTNPEAQKQTAALNKMIEDIESVAHDLKYGNIKKETLEKQERILSRLLDAQKSIHKREFSKKRKSEISEIEDWELPEEIKLKFDKMMKKALLNEDYQDFPKEYQELIREYLRLLNEKAK